MKKRSAVLTIANIGKKRLFKIPREAGPMMTPGLSFEGVYEVLVQRADYGKNVELADLSQATIEGTTTTYNHVLKVPLENAKRIKVFPLS
jgi:hypothetical protein